MSCVRPGPGVGFSSVSHSLVSIRRSGPWLDWSTWGEEYRAKKGASPPWRGLVAGGWPRVTLREQVSGRGLWSLGMLCPVYLVPCLLCRPLTPSPQTSCGCSISRHRHSQAALEAPGMDQSSLGREPICQAVSCSLQSALSGPCSLGFPAPACHLSPAAPRVLIVGRGRRHWAPAAPPPVSLSFHPVPSYTFLTPHGHSGPPCCLGPSVTPSPLRAVPFPWGHPTRPSCSCPSLGQLSCTLGEEGPGAA